MHLFLLLLAFLYFVQVLFVTSQGNALVLFAHNFPAESLQLRSFNATVLGRIPPQISF